MKQTTAAQQVHGIQIRIAHKTADTNKPTRTDEKKASLPITDAGSHAKIVAGASLRGPESNSIGVKASTTANSSSNQVVIWPNRGVARSNNQLSLLMESRPW
jgi:hypothetical protein